MTITKKQIEKLRLRLRNEFSKLEFEEETHSYKLNGKNLISTTQLLNSLSEFDSYNVSEQVAIAYNKKNTGKPKREGVYYRKRWNWIATEATSLGSRVHAFAELYPYFDEAIDEYEDAVLDFFNWFDSKYEVIFQEFKIYDEDYLKAGTIDLLAINKETGNLAIFDFKTNSSNMFQCYANKKLKKPFNSLLAHSYSKYSLQLSDYANMLEKKLKNIKVEGLYLIWISSKTLSSDQVDRGKDPSKYIIDPLNQDFLYSNNMFLKIHEAQNHQELLTQFYETINVSQDKRNTSGARMSVKI